jgi:hypothetical protein
MSKVDAEKFDDIEGQKLPTVYADNYFAADAVEHSSRSEEEQQLIDAFMAEMKTARFPIRHMDPVKAAAVYDALMKDNHHRAFGFKKVVSSMMTRLSPDGNLKRYIMGHKLNLSVVETCMSTMTLVNALVLTIPYGFVGNLSSEFWDNLLLSMEIHGCDQYFYYYYYNMRNDVMAVTYASIAAIVIAVFFYVLKPGFEEGGPNDVAMAQLVKTLENQFLLSSNHLKVVDFGTTNLSNGLVSSDHSNPAQEWNAQIEKGMSEHEKRTQLSFLIWWRDGRWVVAICFLLTATAVLALLCLSYLIFSIFAVPSADICKFHAAFNSSSAIGLSGILLLFCIKKLL